MPVRRSACSLSRVAWFSIGPPPGESAGQRSIQGLAGSHGLPEKASTAVQATAAHAIMNRQITICAIQLRLVVAGLFHAGLQVVRDDKLARAREELEGPYMQIGRASCREKVE